MEDYFHVGAFSSVIAPESWGTFEYRAERNTDRLLELLAGKAIRATFFVLGWVAERSPELVRRIAAAGHEVACHGFSHQLIYTQTPERFREETARAKGLLEDVLGKPVVGYRAASFSIVRESLWALDQLIDLGFAYDSSIFDAGVTGLSVRSPQARRRRQAGCLPRRRAERMRADRSASTS